MEAFFNESTAAQLQYLTFPLELIGLTLALVEVRFPAAARYLTGRIERLSIPLEELRSGRIDGESRMRQSLGTLLSRLLKAGFYGLTALFAVRTLLRWAGEGLGAGQLPALLISYVVAIVVTTVALVVVGLVLYFVVIGGSDFARRFVAGRAIGTLGILIASLGLLGELYQVVTQLVH